MKIRGRRMEAAPRLMIIPMIDIIFFLLVFFMMSMLFMSEQRTLPLQLPAAGGASQTGPSLVLSVDAEGNFYIGSDPVAAPELWDRARVEAGKNPDARFVIRADRETPHGKVVGVLEGLRRAGITRVGIAVEGDAP